MRRPTLLSLLKESERRLESVNRAFAVLAHTTLPTLDSAAPVRWTPWVRWNWCEQHYHFHRFAAFADGTLVRVSKVDENTPVSAYAVAVVDPGEQPALLLKEAGLWDWVSNWGAGRHTVGIAGV